MSGIAVVGTGMWGPRLAAAAQRAGLDLVTCFSRDEEKRREFAERFGCEPAPSLEDAIGHLADELAEFGRCMRGEAEPETGAQEGTAALAAVLQALETNAEAVS